MARYCSIRHSCISSTLLLLLLCYFLLTMFFFFQVVLSQCSGSNKSGFTIVTSSSKNSVRLDGLFNIISYDIVPKLQDTLMASDFKVKSVEWIGSEWFRFALKEPCVGTQLLCLFRLWLQTSLTIWKMLRPSELLLRFQSLRSDALCLLLNTNKLPYLMCL